MDFHSFALIMPVLLFSVVAHEYAHGYAALKQGDSTALRLGRLSWNPARHIDPFMTIILPLFIFISSGGRMMLGGAKPVPVQPANYRNYRRGDIIVSLAGVFTNLLIALACTALVPLLGVAGRAVPAAEPAIGVAQAMAAYGVLLNLVLIAFNLIPIPPLDGSHVVKHLMPAPIAARYEEIGRFGLLILIAMLWFNLIRFWLTPAFAGFRMLFSLVDTTMLPTGSEWFWRLLR